VSSYGDDAGNTFASCKKSVKLLLEQNIPAAEHTLNNNKQQFLLFLVVKGWIKSTCTRKHINEIHTNMSNTANVIDNWL